MNLGGQKNKDQVQSDLDPKPWALIGTSRGGQIRLQAWLDGWLREWLHEWLQEWFETDGCLYLDSAAKPWH